MKAFQSLHLTFVIILLPHRLTLNIQASELAATAVLQTAAHIGTTIQEQYCILVCTCGSLLHGFIER